VTLGTESGFSNLDQFGELWKQDIVPGHSNWASQDYLTVSPRHFDAVTTLTAQILLRGEYRGIFVDRQNCLMIDKDYGNLPEVLEMIKDPVLTQQLAMRAFRDTYIDGKYTYSHFAQQVEEAINAVGR
jgi:hypothetical protein